MLKKFKLVALTSRKTKNAQTNVWANYVIMAHDPFDAMCKVLAKYPGRNFVKISECYPNGNIIVSRSWTSKQLVENEAKIRLEYDFGLKG